MTKKFQRMMEEPAFTEDGRVEGRERHVRFSSGAMLELNGTQPRLMYIRLQVPSLWFDKRSLEELIAELLFLKEEWDNHPIVLEREQKADMEEAGLREAEEFHADPDFVREDNPFDEDEEGLELDEDGELEEVEVPRPLRYRAAPLF